MPRLRSYRNCDACYVLTSIGGAMVTYQLTPEGAVKLKKAGIDPGLQFPRALLLELIRTGDAFTGGTGAGEAATEHGQMALDLANDPDPETALPVCGECRKAEELHLVLSGPPASLIAKLLCPACRGRVNTLDTSIPLSLVSLPVLLRLGELKAICEKHESVNRYEELLRTESSLKWDEIKKHRAATQGHLFDTKCGDDLI